MVGDSYGQISQLSLQWSAFGVPGWGVNFTPKSKCAILGSSVDIGCSYKYPRGDTVEKTLWKMNYYSDVDFSSTPHQGRLTYLGDKNNNCTLRITDVRYSDAGEYNFRFITNTTALPVVMRPAWVKKGQRVTLTCSTTCSLSTNSTYTWNTPVTSRHTIRGNTLTLSSSICAVVGSSVDMGCSYSYPNNVTVKKMFWHKRGSREEDFSKKEEYRNRVKYLGNNINECGQRIGSVRENDSGEYQFRFITNNPNGKMSGSPGVTLLVSSLQVMMSSAAVREGGTVSLTCNSSSCHENVSYIWFQNREPLTKHTSRDLILDPVKSDDSGTYSCAVEGNEKHPSHEVTLSVQSDATSPLIAVGLLLAVIVTMVTGIVCFRRKRRTSTEDTGTHQASDDREMSMQREGMPDTEQEDSNPLYDNISAMPRTTDREHSVDSGNQEDAAYASVQFKAKNKGGVPDSTAEEKASQSILNPSSGVSIAEDDVVIYSTVNKPRC
ncbi:B-cell receptor CD22-like [Sardina pilchardus]|uniref:B-cell receptor CD22-like n=1 Tax=Sardina pilchardus TaxID=27697 RepID=UPI002E142EC9